MWHSMCMKAVVCKQYGPPESLSFEDLPSPRPGPGEAVVSVRAASVNFPDVLIIQNKYQFKPPLPFSPGSELAGVVKEVGPGVSTFRPGDKVMAFTTYGAFAEEVKTEASRLVPMPEGMEYSAASAFLLTYGTSDHALRDRGALKSGETLLVLGAAGGVGLTAVEIGKALGARVLAAASTREKLELAKQHGADAAFNYTTDTIKAKVMEFTGDRGIDVAYDPVGADYAEQVVRSMAWNGRYLVIGFAGGKIPAVPLNLPLLKGCSLVGVFWGAHTRREPQVHAANLKALFELFESGKIRPHVTELDGLDRYAEALDVLNGRLSQGKVVVRVATGEG